MHRKADQKKKRCIEKQARLLLQVVARMFGFDGLDMIYFGVYASTGTL